MFRYAALRLILLVVVGILLYLAGMRGILLAGTTIIVAALVAYVFFGKERDKVVARMEAFRNREREPRVLDEDMLVEDAYVDEFLGEDPATPGPVSEGPEPSAEGPEPSAEGPSGEFPDGDQPGDSPTQEPAE